MKYRVAHFDQIDPVPCPCGLSKRAFVQPDNPTASIHFVDISLDAKSHYHKTFTEIYLILEAEPDAYIELDGDQIPVRPMSTVMIPPLCRHRAVGKMKLINTAIPTFNPDDEWFD